MIYCILKAYAIHILNWKKRGNIEREREREKERVKKTNIKGEYENVSEGIGYKILTCEGKF